jgi:hypothetical protein
MADVADVALDLSVICAVNFLPKTSINDRVGDFSFALF